MTPRAAFWRGFRDGVPFDFMIVPFALLFGVVARDAGLDLPQTMSMSVLVIAGAAQFTAVALLKDQAPVYVALFAALAVNLRMAMYSAALVPHVGKARLGVRALLAYLMVDQVFAAASSTYERNPGLSHSAKVAYYLGFMMLIAPSWYAFTLLGAVVGRAIPASLSLDFAMPVCFIALLAPLLRSAPHIVAALVSAICAILFAGTPWSLGLVIAAMAGVVAGAQTELWQVRRKARAL